MGGRGSQKNPEYVIKSDLKDKMLYCPNEFVHDHSFFYSGCNYMTKKVNVTDQVQLSRCKASKAIKR